MPHPDDEVIRRVVKETLLQLGVDVADSENVIEFQADLRYLRKWRKSVDAIESRAFLAAVMTVLAGIAGAAWLGFKQTLHIGGG